MFNSSLMQVAVTHDLWLGRSVEGFLAREGIDAAGHIWCALLTFFFSLFCESGGNKSNTNWCTSTRMTDSDRVERGKNMRSAAANVLPGRKLGARSEKASLASRCVRAGGGC
jgi:hypothetical protein